MRYCTRHVVVILVILVVILVILVVILVVILAIGVVILVILVVILVILVIIIIIMVAIVVVILGDLGLCCCSVFLVVLTTCRVPFNPLVRRVMIHEWCAQSLPLGYACV